MDGKHSGLAPALNANSIPLQPYAQLADIRVSPHGLVYIPLPDPHDDICLTNYLPLSQADKAAESIDGPTLDAQDIHRLLSIPDVRKTLAAVLIGNNSDVRDYRASIMQSLEQRTGWCLPVIRRTSEVMSSSSPRLIGQVKFTRYTFMSMGKSAAERLSQEHGQRSDNEAYWSYGCWLDPDFGRRGIMTAVCRYIIDQWFAPYISTFPGQLVSGYYAVNRSSARLQQKLGFDLVAKSYWLKEVREERGLEVGDDKERWRSACCVWQGPEGKDGLAKSDTVYKDLEDWD